mgnify:FL=1
MLNKLIQNLSKEEIRHFKLVINSTRQKGDRMDLELFDHIRNSPDSDGEQHFRDKFYKDNPNAYYRLKNRLFQRISNILLLLHSGEDLHHEVLELVLLAKLFYRKEAFSLSHHFLKKGEKKALELDNYDYLNIIYREMIRLSYDVSAIDPTSIIEKQKEISRKQQEINELNNVIAIVMHQLRRTQNLSKGNDEINEMLAQVVEKYSTSEKVSRSFQFRHAIYQAISKFLLQANDYSSLQEYVDKTYGEFVAENLFSKSTHEVKLQMITYLVNSSYMNQRIEQSLEYTDLLYDEMLKHNRLHYHKYLIFYYHSLVLNFSKSNPQKAIKILSELEESKEFVSNPYYIQFILLNLALLNRDSGDMPKAIFNVEKLIANPIFSGLDEMLKVQLYLFRLLCYYDEEDYEEVLKGLKEVRSLEAKQSLKSFRLFEGYFTTLELLAARERFSIDAALKKRCQDLLNQKVDTGETSLIFDYMYWFNDVLVA